MSRTPKLSRRTALKLTGGSMAAITTSSMAAADVGAGVRINVGYDGPNGRKAALDAASNVVREFAFDALTVEVPEPAVVRLDDRSDVRYVEYDGTWQALGCSCRGCGIDSTSADFSCGEGAGADLAIIDTGIQSGHPCLDSHLGAGHACTTCTASTCLCLNLWDDDNGHGTHCAGIAGGDHGVAREATLHAVKVLTAAGVGTWSDVACGIQETTKQGWDVGSMSLGGSSASEAVRDACQFAWDRGVLLVAAAGNSGPCTNCVGYPAAYDTVMAVSAVDCNDNWASFSSQGPEVEITAPGENISSTYPCNSCDTLSGTSMATPHVAGAGAILMANGYDNVGARQRLKNTADDVGLSSNRQGAGRLDVERATC